MTLKVCQVCAVEFTLKHFLLPLIDRMRLETWQVTSVCSAGDYTRDLQDQGYRVINIDIVRGFSFRQHMRSIWHLYKLFKVERFDVVHVHTPVAALLGRIAAKLAGVQCIVYTAHGFYFHDEMVFWKRWAHIALEWLSGRVTDLLFTQSQEDAASAIKYRICSSERVRAIGNGVDIQRFNPDAVPNSAAIRQSLGIPQEAIAIGIIGRFVREKGYIEFLAAAKQLAEVNPTAYFLLVGERLSSDHDTSIGDALDDARLAIGARLIFTGFRSDTPALLSAMDVFCLPSYREGMPRTIIEAMMMGKPVVATDIRGSREEVVDNETGYLVKTRDASALAASIQRLISQPSLAREMGLKGRHRALSLYDETLVLEQQITIIKNYTQLFSTVG